LCNFLQSPVTSSLLGPNIENEHWIIKINSELESKYKSQDIFSVTKDAGLEWIGHVIRLNETRAVKKIFEGEGEEQGDLDSDGLMMWKTI
jgi:hypothetical protein